jgi:putative peptide zinc metalloprotease protein
MSSGRSLFSESWHRVATQRIRLRPSVQIRKQFYRGERWHVAQDAFTHSFFRFTAEAYAFIARLDGSRTVEEIWKHCLELNGERAPGQGEVIQMLAQLYQANLIVSDVPPDTARLFERQKKHKQRELRMRLLSVFFLRLRLWDPDSFLKRTLPYVGWMFTPVAAVVWMLVVGLGLAMAVGDWERLRGQSAGVLEPGNLLLLYLAFTLAKVVHEFGHAYACRRFGGEVHAMGVTLLVFTLVPFVDTTAAWAFRERRKRVLVGLAGMIPELFLAGVAAMIWANTGAGLLNGICYNLMLVASVSTILFNANPLLRFDGYYILADLTDTPNLQQRAQQQLLHVVESRIFGGKLSSGPARSRREGGLLVAFAIASWIYRVIITWTLIILVADKYFGLGLAAAAIAAFGTFLMPIGMAVRYLVREPRIERVRRRATIISVATVTTVLVLISLVPFPRRFRAPGLLRAENYTKVIAEAAGYVETVDAPSRTAVAAGDLLLTLRNPELNFQIAAGEAEREATLALERKVLREAPARIETVRRRLESIDRRLAELREDRETLAFRSRQAGTWISPRAQDYPGLWVPRGTAVGEIVDDRSFEFHAVVSQSTARELFGDEIRRAEIRFPGEAEEVMSVATWRVVPGRQDMLPSPALGWAGGGPIPVATDDGRGLRTAEPFFLVVAKVTPNSSIAMLHDRTGVIRFSLPPEPLLWQWFRELRQLVQQRYQI